jgi:transposase
MRLTEYGRTPQKRKAYVQQSDLLLVGVDVSKAKHSACMGTQTGMSCRKLEFTHTREGFQLFEHTLRNHLDKNHCRRMLIAMEPSGIYWQALYARLKDSGYGVCLVPCQAVRNNRKTMPHGTSKTDEKDAYSIFDLLQQGKFFLPVVRDAELQAAYRLMQRHMALKKRVGQLRNQLRAAIHLAFPELNPLVKDLTQPTALRFLQANPTPESILRHGRTRFLAQWQPRQRCGQWRPETFHRLYDLAQASIGLQDPSRLDEFEITTLGGDLVDALTKQQLWLDKAIELLAQRTDYQLLVQLPRIGKPTAAAILTAIGDIRQYTHGKQLVKLAGLDLRLVESGSSIRKLPKISHVGSAYLRHWLYHYALRLVAHEPPFKAYYARRKHQSPGKGAGQRALVAVCDKIIRMIYRLLTDQTTYNPKKDQAIAEYYAAQRKAAST